MFLDQVIKVNKKEKVLVPAPSDKGKQLSMKEMKSFTHLEDDIKKKMPEITQYYSQFDTKSKEFRWWDKVIEPLAAASKNKDLSQ